MPALAQWAAMPLPITPAPSTATRRIGVERVFAIMAETGEQPEHIASREGLIIVSDDTALRDWISEVLAEHPVEAQRFRAGEKKLQGVLVGFVMKKSKGSADPKRVNQLLAERAIE